MNTGDVILIPFPFAELTNTKVRPAIIVCETKDSYKDLVLCAISSIVPAKFSENEMLLIVDQENGLRKKSVLKVDRIVTAKEQNIIAKIGKLSDSDLEKFKEKF